MQITYGGGEGIRAIIYEGEGEIPTPQLDDPSRSGGCNSSLGQRPKPLSVTQLVGSLFVLGERLGDWTYTKLHR